MHVGGRRRGVEKRQTPQLVRGIVELITSNLMDSISLCNNPKPFLAMKFINALVAGVAFFAAYAGAAPAEDSADHGREVREVPTTKDGMRPGRNRKSMRRKQ